MKHEFRNPVSTAAYVRVRPRALRASGFVIAFVIGSFVIRHCKSVVAMQNGAVQVGRGQEERLAQLANRRDGSLVDDRELETVHRRIDVNGYWETTCDDEVAGGQVNFSTPL
jgi:hypothetical protein